MSRWIQRSLDNIRINGLLLVFPLCGGRRVTAVRPKRYHLIRVIKLPVRGGKPVLCDTRVTCGDSDTYCIIQFADIRNRLTPKGKIFKRYYFFCFLADSNGDTAATKIR